MPDWFFTSSPEDGPPSEDSSAQGLSGSSASDADLLDAYSQAVVTVVEAVAPTVLTIGHKGRRGGSGSGFLITEDGYAVTNSHVARARPQLVAETIEGDRVDADLVGDDPATDLALLRLRARDLPRAQLGDSDQLRVGQLVIAMGSPLGLNATVSTGVVSAIGRSMRGADGRLIENVIQHAAPINPGNSGGPLVDSRGRVVGISTAIIAPAQALGFAVPSATARWVTAELLAHGRVPRRELGVVATTVPIPRRIIRDLDLLGDHAVEILRVVSDSPAAGGGMRPGDWIIAVQGRIVASVDDIHRLLLTELPPEKTLTFDIIRDGRRQETDVRWD